MEINMPADSYSKAPLKGFSLLGSPRLTNPGKLLTSKHMKFGLLLGE